MMMCEEDGIVFVELKSDDCADDFLKGIGNMKGGDRLKQLSLTKE